MHIDDLFNIAPLTEIASGRWQLNDQIISSDWAQGRTLYGGISAGLTYRAINSLVDDTRILRNLTTNFVGPVTPDEPFIIEVELLRHGSNVSQYCGRIIQKDRVCLLATACFGVHRDSAITVENTERHNMTEPNKAKFIPQIPKVTPKFLRHFDLSIAEGGVPFTRQKTHHYHGWMRYKKPPKEFTDAHLVALIDAWPPTLLQMMKWPAPASTVSWNLEFIHPHRPVSGSDWFAYQVSTRQAANGYGHTEATIWDKDNEVVAISRQTVAVFD